MANAKNPAASTEIEQKWEQFSTDELKGLQSFEDVEKLFAQREMHVDSASEELGDGFAYIENKSPLENRPVMLVSWSFNDGDFEKEFVAVRAMCRMDNGTIGKFVFIDGGEGIRSQLRQYTDAHKGQQGGLFVAKGLRVSRYDYTDEKTGKTSPAETWYVDTSA
jgi:hypothetical protein